MALSGYTPFLQWYADSLADLDAPTGTTKSNPGATGDPTLAGTPDQYADFDGAADGIAYTPATAVGNVGTGDVTYVLKLRIDSWTAGEIVWLNWNGGGTSGVSHGFGLAIQSGSNRVLAFYRPPSSVQSQFLSVANGVLVSGQDLIIACRRSAGTWTLWLDVDASGGMTEIVPAGNSIGGAAIDQSGDIVFGGDRAGANLTDGRVYWIVGFAEALADADLQLADWTDEANLKTAWAGGTPNPTLTDLDTDEIITEGQTGIAVTGTDLGTTNANRTFSLIQGSVEVDQTETGTGTSTGATLSAVLDSTTDIKFGSATLRVTRDDSATGDLAATVNPATGELYVDLTSIHGTSSERITAVPDLAIGDQIHARGVGGGAAPAGLFLNADGTFGFTAGNPEQDFEVRAWDATDSTWQDGFAVQSVGGTVSVIPGAIQRPGRGFSGHIASRLGGHLH